MKIGEALRQERLRLNLSQSQMAGDVLTKSFYSKVERNLCSIRANDLLSILSLHNIDYSYFFEKLKFENNDNELSETECNNLLHAAYYNNDWSKILKLQELIKQKILVNLTWIVLMLKLLLSKLPFRIVWIKFLMMKKIA